MSSLFRGALAAASVAGLAAMTPVAADEARDEIIRTEGQLSAISEADAAKAAPMHWADAAQRLEQARSAESAGDDDEAIWRAEEASLKLEIVQAKIKLHGLERTASELEDSVATLRRELTS